MFALRRFADLFRIYHLTLPTFSNISVHTYGADPLYRPSFDTLQPQTDEFERTLNNSVKELQNDFTSGARELAETSIKALIRLSRIEAQTSTYWGDSWARLVLAAKHLSAARPSMGAAITASNLRALECIARLWNEKHGNGIDSTTEFARAVEHALERVLKKRKQEFPRLIGNFQGWLHHYRYNMLKDDLTRDQGAISILTLSNSSTVRRAILHALMDIPDLHFYLTIMESRPRCEGADMASYFLLKSGDAKNRLSIRIIPDCAVATAVRGVDFVLLGADRISSTGDVSNKIGSLSAAVCAKQLNPKAHVVVLTDVDKIAVLGLEEPSAEHHPVHELSKSWRENSRSSIEEDETVKIFDEWFEWVPNELVHTYITDMGTLTLNDVRNISGELGKLHQSIFRTKD